MKGYFKLLSVLIGVPVLVVVLLLAIGERLLRNSPDGSYRRSEVGSCVMEVNGYYHCAQDFLTPTGMHITLRQCSPQELSRGTKECWSNQQIPPDHQVTSPQLLGIPSVSTARDQDIITINSYIAQQAKHEEGEEYKEARKVIEGDLNKDGTPDEAVLYTIEGQGGGNNYTQYLAVFVRSKVGIEPLARAQVGGKNVASVELIAVGDNTIYLTELRYGPSDASCCPSEKSQTRYALVGHLLKEQKDTPTYRHQ